MQHTVKRTAPTPALASRPRRRVPLAVLAAVLILSTILAATAYATGFRVADWFPGLFPELSVEEGQVLEDRADGVKKPKGWMPSCTSLSTRRGVYASPMTPRRR